VLTQAQTEQLAGRVADLLANDTQFAAALPRQDVSETVLRPGIGWAGLMRALAEGYADRPALGMRAVEVVNAADSGRKTLQLLSRFDTITYRQLWQRVSAVAAWLSHCGVQVGDRVATLGTGSLDYTTFDMSVPLLGAVSVALHAGSPASQLQAMVDETEPAVIACSAEYLSDAVELAIGGHTPFRLVVFDYYPGVDDHREALDAARCSLADSGSSCVVEMLATAVARGSALLPAPDLPADDERLSVIVYTSGSSGSPKGAMHHERLAMGAWTYNAAVLIERGFALPAITLNYMPMSHTAGRAMLYGTLGCGGTVFFVGKSDLSTILEDLSLVRPTQLNFVPRIWEMLHREFVSEVDAKGGRAAVAEDVEEKVLADLRSRILGGRYIAALTGSAPISAELAAWVERLLESHLMDALGATESGSVVVDGKIQRPTVTDYKLVDVPELGYFSTDRPYPRGELLIKSSMLFRGYYKRPELTAEVFDEDGFYRTGDVVAQIGPDDIRYVERRNNVLKLSQGEFVAISKLEAVYSNCEFVRHVYVYGNSERSYLLAVVVPTKEALARHDATALKSLILRSLQEAARAADLGSYEIPRDIILDPSPFTVDNGLLTAARKPSRPNLKAHYGKRLEQLYADLAEAQHDRLRALRAHATRQPVIETVCAAVGALLGAATEDPTPDAHFTDLGGDSLSALTFVNALGDIFDVEVPVSVIISPATDLRAVADYIEAQRAPGRVLPTSATVHGAGATVVRAQDLTLDKFLDASTLDGAHSAQQPSSEVSTVLLTGATGYLGRYLALHWLERMKSIGGKLICLVRAKDNTGARARLDAVFDSGDAELLNRYRTLAADQLEVLAGDKGCADLGLDHETWQRLAGTVDLIVDPAALVNHMLPYRQLFGPNVVGTAELIHLALTVRQKPIAYVSSVVVGMTVTSGECSEDADIRRVSAARSIDGNYASGYATSKWASEVLLREAHDLCGLPVAVFRCDMIMAETGYRGQLNVPDVITRLILSIAATGLAPESFYLRDPGGRRARAHFDGLPVDFVAESISILSTNTTGDRKAFRTFNVTNPHDDGIGLDQYVEWIADAGCPVERIGDYDQWFARFETALRNLPENQRQASLLPLLDSYRHPLPPTPAVPVPSQRFRAAVMQAGIGPDGDIPQIGRAVIEKYLTDLELLGLLDGNHRTANEIKES